MRINTKNKSTIFTILAAAGICLALAATVLWYLSIPSGPQAIDTTDTPIDVEPAPSKLSDEDATSKQHFIEQQQDTKDTPDSNPDASSQTTETDTPNKIELITKQDGSSVTVITKISGIGEGVCSLSATNGGKSYDMEVDIIYQPNYSTCAGFSIPVSTLGKGTWEISVVATSSNGSKSVATSSLEAS